MIETSDHQPKLLMPFAGSSCAAKKEQPTAAIIGAEAPSAQPVAIHSAQQSRIARAAPAADHSASAWSRCRDTMTETTAPDSGWNASATSAGSEPPAMAR